MTRLPTHLTLVCMALLMGVSRYGEMSGGLVVAWTTPLLVSGPPSLRRPTHWHSFVRASSPLHAKTEASRQEPTQNATTSKKETSAESAEPASNKVQQKLEQARARIQAGENLTQAECDALLAKCVAEDEWDSVLDVLDIMKSQNLRQVQSTYQACLQACFDVSNAASSQEILNAMSQAGVTPEAEDIGLTVATMCLSKEEGWWRSALELVRAHDDLPIASYDAVLSCLIDQRQWQSSVRLLRGMEKSSGTQPAASTYRSVIECCVACNQVDLAVQVLQACVRQGVTPTVYPFELVISALSKKLQWRRAMHLLEMMDELKLPKTLVCFNSVLSALSRTREVVQAKNLLVRMRKSGIQPNIISYNTVLAAAASAGRWMDALTVLDQCHREPGVTPDIYTYTNAIRACAKGGKTRRALTLLQVVKDKRLPIDTYCYTAAIEACAKAEMWVQALELLDEMESKGIAPSEVTYSVTISACGNGGQWEKALELLDIMRNKNLRINLITYNAAITAVSKAAKQLSKSHTGDGNLWTRAMDLLDRMRADGIEPDGFSFSSAISCCGAEGRWEEALQLLDRMEDGGPRTRPNKIAYSAAISSCGKAGQVDHAIRLFRQMRDQGISADRVAYNALFSALRVSKRSDAAFDLWNEMVGQKQSNTTAIATALADGSTTPDIITVTDAIGAMSSDFDTQVDRDKVDQIFREAVCRGIILRSDSLDSQWEIDLSGMSLPVARAACRYVLNDIAKTHKEGNVVKDLTFITGVGKGKGESCLTSLREFVQLVLDRDFDPPMSSAVPRRALGTVEIPSDKLLAWLNRRAR